MSEKQKSSEIHLVTLCSLNDAVEAELVRSTLLDHQIDCQLDGEHQAGFTGILKIGIIVRESDVSEATDIITIHYPHLFG